MSATPFAITLPDGRELHAQSEGDLDGVLLIFHHGEPRRGRAVPDLRPCGGRAGIRL
jgi:hypothetical protein